MDIKREIKFRAWDKNKRVMINSKEIVRFFYDNEKLSASNGDTVHNELMQFTGLHDKNGKEIYFDSTILKFKDSIFVLELHDKKFGFICPSIRWIKSERIWDYNEFCYDHSYACEVIGNVFENKELLNDNKRTNTN